MEPRVTVLMSVHNGEKYLGEAVESILHQTYRDFEFLIIDDASTDNTLNILQRYEDPRIKIIRNTVNLGLTKSLNIGLGRAKGEFIARMDADDISFPRRLEHQITYLDQHPEIAALGTGAYVINDTGSIDHEIKYSESPTFQELLKGNQFVHGSIVMRKDVLTEVGYYSDLFQMCQDYELWLRIIKIYPMRNISDILYLRCVHDNCISSRYWERSALFSILAKKIALKTADPELIQFIKTSDISILKYHLNLQESMQYINAWIRNMREKCVHQIHKFPGWNT